MSEIVVAVIVAVAVAGSGFAIYIFGGNGGRNWWTRSRPRRYEPDPPGLGVERLPEPAVLEPIETTPVPAASD